MCGIAGFFGANAGSVVKKMTDIYLDKKIEGIAEVRDESDRENPVRIVVDLKKINQISPFIE